MLPDGAYERWQVVYWDQRDAGGPQGGLSGDYGGADLEGLTDGDGIAIVERGAQQDARTGHGSHSGRVGHIAGQQNVFRARLRLDSRQQFVLEASRTEHHQARIGEFLADVGHGIDLQRQIVFGFQLASGKQDRIVGSEETGQRLGERFGSLIPQE